MSLVASPKLSSERSAARAAIASKIRDDLWAEACRREEALRDLMRLHPGRFPEIAAPEACFALGVSRAALFRLIERFKTEKTVSALPPRKCGRAAGSKNDDPKRDRLIRRTIERLYFDAGTRIIRAPRRGNSPPLRPRRPGFTKLARRPSQTR
jgi:hypothetical protein